MNAVKRQIRPAGRAHKRFKAQGLLSEKDILKCRQCFFHNREVASSVINKLKPHQIQLIGQRNSIRARVVFVILHLIVQTFEQRRCMCFVDFGNAYPHGIDRNRQPIVK